MQVNKENSGKNRFLNIALRFCYILPAMFVALTVWMVIEKNVCLVITYAILAFVTFVTILDCQKQKEETE